MGTHAGERKPRSVASGLSTHSRSTHFMQPFRSAAYGYPFRRM